MWSSCWKHGARRWRIGREGRGRSHKDCMDATRTGLAKVQLYKLKKILTPKEEVFLTVIDGKNCDIQL